MLADIFTPVNTALALLVPTVTTGIGGHEVHTNNAPPRVVWVPYTETFGPGEKSTNAQYLGRSLHMRKPHVQAHLWGETVAATEALLAAVVIALRSTLYGEAYHLVSGEWPEIAGGTIASFGVKYILVVELKIPLIDTVPSLATAAQIEGIVRMHPTAEDVNEVAQPDNVVDIISPEPP